MRVFAEAYGCTLNQGEGRSIARRLQEGGHRLVERPEEAEARELEPDIVNITRFSPRPGTPAAEMDGQVPGWVAKERSRELTRLRFRLARRNQRRFVGRRLRVLTAEVGRDETTLARAPDYRPVVLPGRLPLGRFLDVVVEGCTATYLRGRPQAR